MSKKLGHTDQYKDGRNWINAKLSLIKFEEEGLHFVYSHLYIDQCDPAF